MKKRIFVATGIFAAVAAAAGGVALWLKRRGKAKPELPPMVD